MSYCLLAVKGDTTTLNMGLSSYLETMLIIAKTRRGMSVITSSMLYTGHTDQKLDHPMSNLQSDHMSSPWVPPYLTLVVHHICPWFSTIFASGCPPYLPLCVHHICPWLSTIFASVCPPYLPRCVHHICRPVSSSNPIS